MSDEECIGCEERPAVAYGFCADCRETCQCCEAPATQFVVFGDFMDVAEPVCDTCAPIFRECLRQWEMNRTLREFKPDKDKPN
jgi:hypothetical protein